MATVSWQILNQAFNATVNYTNRNAASVGEAEDTERIKQAFVGATAASCAAALSFRKLLSSRGTLAARWAPFFAVAIGNMVNLPIMRQLEIQRGIPVSAFDAEKSPIMNSRVAAVKAVSECVTSRIVMAAPGMLLIPVITRRFESYCFYQRRPWLGPALEIGMVAFLLVNSFFNVVRFLLFTEYLQSIHSLFFSLLFMIPTALAIYPQRNSLNAELLKLRVAEHEEFSRRVKDSGPEALYYNKGL